MSKHHKAHRADDKRNPGLGDNVRNTVQDDSSTGSGHRLMGIYHDRRGEGHNGKGKRSS